MPHEKELSIYFKRKKEQETELNFLLENLFDDDNFEKAELIRKNFKNEEKSFFYNVLKWQEIEVTYKDITKFSDTHSEVLYSPCFFNFELFYNNKIISFSIENTNILKDIQFKKSIQIDIKNSIITIDNINKNSFTFKEKLCKIDQIDFQIDNLGYLNITINGILSSKVLPLSNYYLLRTK